MQQIKQERINKARQSVYDIQDAFPVSFMPSKTGTYFIDIIGEISDASQFSDAISVLNMVDEDSDVVINLSTNGGSLAAADSLIHALRKTKANVHFVASGICHSAGSLLLLEAHSFELSEGFSSLIHCGSLGNIGAFNQYKSQAAFDVMYMERTMRNAYRHFLTEEEIENVLKGQDLWLDAEQWMVRSEARNECYKQEHLAYEAAMLAEQEATKHACQPFEGSLDECAFKPAKKPLKLAAKLPKAVAEK
jgi:ATP-dependent protease ClpP protease subunit